MSNFSHEIPPPSRVGINLKNATWSSCVRTIATHRAARTIASNRTARTIADQRTAWTIANHGAAKRLNMNNRGWSRLRAEPTDSTQKHIVPEGGEQKCRRRFHSHTTLQDKVRPFQGRFLFSVFPWVASLRSLPTVIHIEPLRGSLPCGSHSRSMQREIA